MAPFYSCIQPLCNKKMLVEDYTSAILWRISAIFFSIAALFSVATVFWFLVFRENPDRPDDTDSLEQSRFIEEFDREKHNLLSEIIGEFKTISSIYTPANSSPSNQSFFHRLVYFFCGSTAVSTDVEESQNVQVNESYDLKPKVSKNKNKNKNNNQSYEGDLEEDQLELKKSFSLPLIPTDQILSLNDKLLFELNKNFEDVIIRNYADARVTVNYLENRNVISIAFYSILNISSNKLSSVQILIDIFYKDKWKKRLVSKSSPIDIAPNSEKLYEQNFFIEFKQIMKVQEFKINVFMIGIVTGEQNTQLERSKSASKQRKSCMLSSQSSINDIQILGGAHLVLKNLI